MGGKLHLMVDTTHEIPITANITQGNVADVYHATPFLSYVRYITGKFHPEYIICDTGYARKNLRKVIKRQWRAHPIIKAAKTYKKQILEEISEWPNIFNRRIAVERVCGRAKNHRRLNNITARRCRRMTIHSLIPAIVKQAVAIAFPETPRNCIFKHFVTS